jgi:hypothetical protein
MYPPSHDTVMVVAKFNNLHSFLLLLLLFLEGSRREEEEENRRKQRGRRRREREREIEDAASFELQMPPPHGLSCCL